MSEGISSNKSMGVSAKSKWKHGEVRPLTTDERASFVILSLYMAVFCACTFMYWNSLALKILGVTSAAGGAFLFVAAFFNTEAAEKSNSIHPLRSYLLSLLITLAVLFSIRFVGGLVGSFLFSAILVYSGMLVALVVFRKALVQVVSALLVLVFAFVTFDNRDDVLMGRMKFKDAIFQCRQIFFQIGPIEDVKNLLLAGNYMGYLSRIDYRDKQVNILATRTVLGANDDELEKTKAILGFVSNEIQYVSDPGDGVEFAKDPATTLAAGGGDCEDQSLLLCSMLESVGVKTYLAFTDDHVFVLVRFGRGYPELDEPFLIVEGAPCHALDAADPGAWIGRSAASPEQVKRVFDVRRRSPVSFSPGKTS